jgi:hypothetical protein
MVVGFAQDSRDISPLKPKSHEHTTQQQSANKGFATQIQQRHLGKNIVYVKKTFLKGVDMQKYVRKDVRTAWTNQCL